MDKNTLIAEYLKAKEAEAEAKKRVSALKDAILTVAGSADNFRTDDYTVIIKTTSSVRLDTVALYRDFPDMKDVYGKVTTSKTVCVAVTAEPEKKTA